MSTSQLEPQAAVTCAPPVARPFALPCPCLLPALASGALLWLCYFPVGLTWLAWVALVPLLALVRSAARPRRIWSAWAGGLLFSLAALHWITAAAHVGMYGAWVALGIYCSLYFPLAVFLIRRLDRGTGLPLVLTAPAVWAGLELLRAELGTGFAWYFLGHTQHNFLSLIQVADITGVYGVTFLVVAVNVLAFELLYRWPAFRAVLSLPAQGLATMRRALPAQAAAVALLIGSCLVYGTWRVGQDEFAPGPRVALLQTDLDQRLKVMAFLGTGDKKARETIARDYGFLCLLAGRQNPPPDLIVGPESSFPGSWLEISDKLPTTQIVAKRPLQDWRKEAEFLRRVAGGLAATTNVSLLVGANHVALQPDGTIMRANSALLVRTAPGKAGGLRVVDRYDKIHCVPFGEYVPMRQWLPFMNAFSPYGFDFSVHPGDRQTRFPLELPGRTQPVHFGVLICYEDSDARLSRRMALPEGDEPGADFIVNISNDGWFNGSSQHEEHLAVCRFRAIESRRAVVRSVNMGISAVIDANGIVLEPHKQGIVGDVEIWKIGETGQATNLDPSRWSEFKKTQGVLLATIPIDDRVSIYARWGDWLPWSCWLLVAAALAWRWRPRNRLARG